jgi:predicted alpha-1,2-mannosidase
MSDVSLSEAVIKLPHCPGTSSVAATHGLEVPAARAQGYCVNATALYKASLKNAMVEPTSAEKQGRVCLNNYTALGYIPYECSDATVSRSMNYWHGDYALSAAAAVLGDTATGAALKKRSDRWTTLFDPESKFFRTKHANGTFSATFDQYAWGPEPGYTEAGPWQYRFEVPYDPKALYSALQKAGVADPCDLIQQANVGSGAFHKGGYSSDIHEMTELAVNCWAQWELNNQPVWALEHMQVAFDTTVTGKCASQAQKWLRQSNSMLAASDAMYPGDEDNGSMGAWFIFNMLGIYPLSPASTAYVIGSPLFANVTLDVGAARPLSVTAANQAPDNVYVQALTWNGKPVAGVSMEYADLMQGGELHFTMGSKPAYLTHADL